MEPVTRAELTEEEAWELAEKFEAMYVTLRAREAAQARAEDAAKGREEAGIVMAELEPARLAQEVLLQAVDRLIAVSNIVDAAAISRRRL